MDEAIVKYNQLDKASRVAVSKFIEFLYAKKNNKGNKLSEFKKDILNISAWNDEDIEIYKEVRRFMNEWKIDEW